MYEHVGRMNVRPFQEDEEQGPGQVSLACSCLLVIRYQINHVCDGVVVLWCWCWCWSWCHLVSTSDTPSCLGSCYIGRPLGLGVTLRVY